MLAVSAIRPAAIGMARRAMDKVERVVANVTGLSRYANVMYVANVDQPVAICGEVLRAMAKAVPAVVIATSWKLFVPVMHVAAAVVHVVIGAV